MQECFLVTQREQTRHRFQLQVYSCLSTLRFSTSAPLVLSMALELRLSVPQVVLVLAHLALVRHSYASDHKSPQQVL